VEVLPRVEEEVVVGRVLTLLVEVEVLPLVDEEVEVGRTELLVEVVGRTDVDELLVEVEVVGRTEVCDRVLVLLVEVEVGRAEVNDRVVVTAALEDVGLLPPDPGFTLLVTAGAPTVTVTV
jgi:hypothetical protein